MWSQTEIIVYIVATIFTGLVTFLAVLVALFGKALISKLFPPVFEFRILKAVGERCPITDRDRKHIGDGRYYHLTVQNTRRWVVATHAQLRLIRIEVPGPDGQFQIKWDGDIPIRRRHQEFYPTESVIGSPIDYDLCAIVNTPTDKPTTSLMPIIAANNLPYKWSADCHFMAGFQLKCSEGDSKMIRIQFDWDGIWHDGDAEIQDHFKAKQVREV